MFNALFKQAENVLNDELHVKLIKIYLKSKNYMKAIRHILKIEFKSCFTANKSPSVVNFYAECIGAIETVLGDFEMMRMNYDYVESDANSYNLKFMYLIISILINHYLLYSLQLPNQVTDFKKIGQLFLKYCI
jgi:site-specific DNA-adenine methylase